MTTLLTGDISEKGQKESAGREKDWTNFEALLELLSEAYVAKEIGTDKLCLWTVTIAKEFEGNYMPSVPEHGRDRLIGSMMMRALSARPPAVKKPKAYPDTIKKIAFELVNIARVDGYTKTREGNKSAYIKVSEVLEKLGLELSPRLIEKYYNGVNKLDR